MWIIRLETLPHENKIFLFDSLGGKLYVESYDSSHHISDGCQSELSSFWNKIELANPVYRFINSKPRIAQAYSAPIKLYVDITDECNLHCKHCLNSTLHSSNKLSLSMIQFIAQECYENGIFFVKLGGGEPLLHPDFLSIINTFREKDVFISLSTNGYYITDDIAKFLAKNQVRVTVSIEGPAAIDEAIRGPGHFNVAINALRILKHHNVDVDFRVTLSSMLLEESVIYELRDLAIAENAHIKFAYCKPSGMATANSMIITSRQRNQYIKIIDILNAPANRNYFIIENGMEYCQNSFFERLYYASKGCGAGSRTMHINASAQLSPCVFLGKSFTSERTYKEGDIMRFWRGELDSSLPILRALPFPEECRLCKRNCSGQCIALRLYHSGTMLGKNPNCLNWF